MADETWGMDKYDALTSQFPDMNHGNPYYVPTLHYDSNWVNAHDITGSDFTNPPSASPVDPNVSPHHGDPPDPGYVPFKVAPGSIRDVVAEMLPTLKGATDTYEEFRTYFKSLEDWVFIAPTKPDAVNYAVLDSEGGNTLYTFNSMDDVKQLILGVELTISGIGNAIETGSQYVARLNDAAQAYAHADQQAFGK